MSERLKMVPNIARVKEVTRRLAQNVTLGLGRGSPSWDSDGLAPFAGEETALIDQLAHVRPFFKGYLKPDPNGEINHGQYGKFSISQTPTRHGVFRFRLDYEDAVNESVREMAAFEDAQFSNVGDGQIYIPQSNILSSGTAIDMIRFTAWRKLKEQRVLDLTIHP